MQGPVAGGRGTAVPPVPVQGPGRGRGTPGYTDSLPLPWGLVPALWVPSCKTRLGWAGLGWAGLGWGHHPGPALPAVASQLLKRVRQVPLLLLLPMKQLPRPPTMPCNTVPARRCGAAGAS